MYAVTAIFLIGFSAYLLFFTFVTKNIYYRTCAEFIYVIMLETVFEIINASPHSESRLSYHLKNLAIVATAVCSFIYYLLFTSGDLE
jgi:hypothetical protein